MLFFMLHFGVASRYNFVLCLVMLFCNVILLFCNVAMLFFVLLCHFAIWYRRFVCINVIFCVVMLFCNDERLFYKLQSYFVSCYVILQSFYFNSNTSFLCFISFIFFICFYCFKIIFLWTTISFNVIFSSVTCVLFFDHFLLV